ncbi:MAG: alcohol dehydrogenase catalytic domain-containing protein [Actinobacteria bacterium]|nr:alcohol dehydrogenase catalytic domain-containing protein [Actinomycetota bacterium]
MTTLPATMRAAVYKGDRRLEVEERTTPDLGPHDVLLEVSHCGVCGSDIHHVLEGWGAKNTIGGHEFSGRVVAVGDAVTSWKPGDEVIGGPSARCGECEFCLAGRPSLCAGRGAVGESDSFQGAFADYVKVRDAELLRVPDGLSLRHAALTEPLAVALHGITRSGVQPGQRALVTGAGPIGSLTVAALVAKGVTDVVVSEPSPVRRALCERLGARTVEPDSLVPPPSPNYLVDDPFDVALECSGNARAMEAALSQLKRTGTLVLVGAGIKPPRFDPNRILLNELVVTGAFCYDGGGFDAALALLASPGFPRDELVEPDDVSLDGLLGAIERLSSGEIPAKVLVAPSRRGMQT